MTARTVSDSDADTVVPRTIVVTDVVDRSAFAGLPFAVSVYTVLALVFDGFDIQAVGFVAPALLHEWAISKAQLGPALAAGLIGMAVGSLAIGPLGDRYGRRAALIVSMLTIAGGSLLCAYASDTRELALWRFLTGLGLGGTLPNATALMMEFAPLAVRHVVVSITIVGVPIGGVIGAELARLLLPAYGWRSVFVAGAILPALLAIAMAIGLPESPRYLARHRARRPQLARLLNRLRPGAGYTDTDEFVVPEAAHSRVGAGLAALLAPGYRRDTLLLWLAFLSNVFSVYCFFSWLPTVLTGAGFGIDVALRGALAFNLGGVLGTVPMALAMTRWGSRPVLITLGVGAIAVMFGLAALAGSLQGGGEPGAMWLLMALAGATVQGLQVAMYSLAANAYPTAARASGIGAGVGIGRLGGILSSFIGSLLALLHASIAPFFVGIACVLVITTAAVAAFGRHIPATARPSSSRAG